MKKLEAKSECLLVVSRKIAHALAMMRHYLYIQTHPLNNEDDDEDEDYESECEGDEAISVVVTEPDDDEREERRQRQMHAERWTAEERKERGITQEMQLLENKRDDGVTALLGETREFTVLVIKVREESKELTTMFRCRLVDPEDWCRRANSVEQGMKALRDAVSWIMYLAKNVTSDSAKLLTMRPGRDIDTEEYQGDTEEYQGDTEEYQGEDENE